MADICVAHLVRGQNGIEPFKAFLDSYRKYPAGISHDLLIIFKGFTDADAGHAYRAQLGDIAHRTLSVPDEGFDVLPYVTAAQNFDNRYFFFLNSYSRILAADWLAKIHQHATRAGVGLVGATGSCESMYTSFVMIGRLAARPRSVRERLDQELYQRARRAQLRLRFKPFPNPHVRTNAFLIARELLLRIKVGAQREKTDAQHFESGRAGLTRQIAAMNLSALVVGRDGRAYTREEWRASRTFRSGDQENLLVADNRTDQYQRADPATKGLLAEFAWGEVRG